MTGRDIKIQWCFLTDETIRVRFRKNDVYPTLVASVQTPIIYCPKKKSWRYLTPHEVSKLQSFPKEFKLDSNDHQAYKQFGNSVNVKVVEYVINAYLLDKLLK